MSNHTDKEMAVFYTIGEKATQSLIDGEHKCGCPFGQMVLGAADKAVKQGLAPDFVSDLLHQCAEILRKSWEEHEECGCEVTTH